jgi:hypothetical protein
VAAVVMDHEITDPALPVIEKELADTWIWGIGSDPVKTMQTRSIHRAR